MLKQEVKVKVEFTPGYETRFTEACLRQLESRERNRMGLNPPPCAGAGKEEPKK